MRNLFIVLAKVVGLLQIATVINYLQFQIGYINYIVGSEDWLYSLRSQLVNMVGYSMCMGLVLGFAWVLLFRTNWIANRLGIPEGEELSGPKQDSFLPIGIKLLGVYILVDAVPGFVWVMIEPRAFNPDESAAHFWIRIVPSVLKLAFGLILVGKTSYVMELISGDSKPKEEPSA
jgi:hypothetical protein